MKNCSLHQQGVFNEKARKIRAAEQAYMAAEEDAIDEELRLDQAYEAACDEAQRVAARATQDIQRSAYVRQKEVFESSYEMAAKALGLVGVTSDIHKYVSEASDYDVVQPLLSMHDLRLALYDEAENSTSTNSPLTTRFYDVTSSDEALRRAIFSLDLAQGAQLFKHRCVFDDAPPIVAEPNTLYFTDFESCVMCTVLSPKDGHVLTYFYGNETKIADITIANCNQDGRRSSFLEENAAVFIQDIYNRNGLSNFNAFEYLLSSVPRFEEHCLQTIVGSNRALAVEHGFEKGIKLTKRHLLASAGELYGLNQTPLFTLKRELSERMSALSKTCYADFAKFDKQRTKAKALVKAELISARQAYRAALNEIQAEAEWQLLEVLIPTSVEELPIEDPEPVFEAKLASRQPNQQIEAEAPDSGVQTSKLNIFAPIFTPKNNEPKKRS